MINHVVVVGNLTAEVETKMFGDTMGARFTIACNMSKERVYYIPVEVWGKTAEAAAKYLGKGSKVGVEGYIKTGSYTDKNGITRKTFAIDASTIEYCDYKDGKK
jgi:single-strand DNA-binding protein